MKKKYQLSIISFYLSFVSICNCSTGNILTDELAESPPIPAVTQRQPPPPTQPAPPKNTFVEESERDSITSRSSISSAATDRDSITSTSGAESGSIFSKNGPSALLDAIKAHSLLKKTGNTEIAPKKDLSSCIAQQLTSLKIVSSVDTAQVLEKKVEVIDLEKKGELTDLQKARMSLIKRPSSSYTYTYDDNNAPATSSSSVESDSASGANQKSTAKKTEAIQGKVPEADFSYIGNARIVKNKK